MQTSASPLTGSRMASGAWALKPPTAATASCTRPATVPDARSCALIAAVRRTPSITLLEGVEARRLIVEDDAVLGVLAASAGEPLILRSNRVVMATGGIGGLFAESTNPAGCFGQGLALAARAGATLSDLEFVQFHPTAFDGPSRPMPLLTEAIRGDGAVLIDETGERFMADEPGAELAPRDVVARAVWRHRAAGHRTFLDARKNPGADFARRYPVISAFCKMAGVDPAMAPIPIRPAVHYHMGGIAVDGDGRSTVRGLWACGETARTGLHGANRLASNSLMEAIVCAFWVARSVGGADAGEAHGEFAITARGVPSSGSGTMVLQAIPTGSRLRVRGTVEVRIPMMGGRIERYVAELIARDVPQMQQFTASWIAGEA